jgi:hypothetical protein
MSLTLGQLIEHYRNDSDSSFSNLRYQVRVTHERMLTRINREQGSQQLQNIRARTLITWHREWASGSKFAMARSLADQLRVLFRFGATILEDRECGRLFDAFEEIRFQKSAPRAAQMTAEQAHAICSVARVHFGWHSIALAQAFQFECSLRQKEVIGEWVPIAEPGVSTVIDKDEKWIRGLVWQEIDENLILRHVTSKRQKETEVDLKLVPMILDEFLELTGGEPVLVTDKVTKEVTANRHLLPASGPVVICDTNGLPWSTAEFRRKWRLVAKRAGIPDNVRNRDSFSRVV